MCPDAVGARRVRGNRATIHARPRPAAEAPATKLNDGPATEFRSGPGYVLLASGIVARVRAMHTIVMPSDTVHVSGANFLSCSTGLPVALTPCIRPPDPAAGGVAAQYGRRRPTCTGARPRVFDTVPSSVLNEPYIKQPITVLSVSNKSTKHRGTTFAVVAVTGWFASDRHPVPRF